MNADDVIQVLAQGGPLTGAQLLERTGGDVFALWQTCRNAPRVRTQAVGRRFLRLDRTVEGYARLSPSIRREFLTYTVLGLETQADLIADTARRLTEEIQLISREKFRLAGTAIASALAGLEAGELVLEKACFILAGDVTYGMSHTVPRPESSTGKMVRGSDLDIIAITADDLPRAAAEELDDAIFKQKHFLLVHPDYREEIDYLIKNLARVRSQLRFDRLEAMIACKIMDEGEYLAGSRSLFATVKRLLEEHGIPGKLLQMEKQAQANRDDAEQRLALADADLHQSRYANLFYTQEEGDEIY